MFNSTDPLYFLYLSVSIGRWRLSASRLISRSSNINGIYDNAFDPGILQDPGNLLSTVVRNQGTHKIQARIQAARHPTAGDDPQPTKLHRSSSSIRFATSVGLLPCVAALTRNRSPPASLRVYVRILIQVLA